MASRFLISMLLQQPLYTTRSSRMHLTFETVTFLLFTVFTSTHSTRTGDNTVPAVVKAADEGNSWTQRLLADTQTYAYGHGYRGGKSALWQLG
jgi:hypothetical protein